MADIIVSSKTFLAAVLGALAVAIAACGGPEPSPTATPAPPPAPSPTATSTPPPEPSPTVAPTPSPEPLFPFTVTGSNGREIAFDAPPERIVAVGSAVVEILFAIGEGHRVAATHDFVSYPPETAEIPRIGDAFNLNYETILELDPDLVFVFSEGAVADLERLGLRVLYIASLSDDFRGVADNIRLWGRIAGSPAAAEAVASDFEERIGRIEEAMAPRGDGPAVFQDVGGLWTPGPDTLMGGVFRLLKMRNIAHDISGYAQISPEAVVERAPEVMIAADADAASAHPSFADLPAVRSGRIFVPEGDMFSVAGPRYVDDIEALAEWVYPDLFE